LGKVRQWRGSCSDFIQVFPRNKPNRVTFTQG
jgi:hypothetical protein